MIPCRKKWQPTPVLLLRKSYWQRSLVSYIHSTGSQSWTWPSTCTHMPTRARTHTHTHTMAKMLDITSDQENTNQDPNEIPFHTHEYLCVCVCVCKCVHVHAWDVQSCLTLCHPTEWLETKSQKTDVVKDVEKLEASYAVGVWRRGCKMVRPLWKTTWQLLKQLNTE